nr:hypothetical protein [Taibaiella helva]
MAFQFAGGIVNIHDFICVLMGTFPNRVIKKVAIVSNMATPAKMQALLCRFTVQVNQMDEIMAIAINDCTITPLCLINATRKLRWISLGTSLKVGNTLNFA